MKVETIYGVDYYVWRKGDDFPDYQPINATIIGGKFHGKELGVLAEYWNCLFTFDRIIWPKLLNDRARHQRMIDEAYIHACEKHPKFCNEFTNYGLNHVSECLASVRDITNKTGNADDILNEEYLEVIESYLKGNLNDCLHELAQCGAVVKRMMEYVQAQIDKECKQ